MMPMLYFLVIIAIRYSGTDTYGIYEQLLKTLLEGRSNTLTEGLEPGFLFLSKLLLWVTGSEVLAVRGIGVVFIALLVAYLLRADRIELKLMFLYFVPVFLYQYSMNGIRAGLGLAVILLAWQEVRRGRWGWFVLLGMVSLMLHYSMALPLALLIVFGTQLKSSRLILVLGLMVAAVVVLITVRREYFESKLLLYTGFDSPQDFSGVSRLILVILVWLFFAASALSFGAKVRMFVGLVTLSLGFQALALFSYSGLRLLELMAFVAPLLMIREYDRRQIAPSKIFWVGLAIAGLLGAAFVYRNFLSDFDGQLTGTETPFLPYRTLFDYKP